MAFSSIAKSDQIRRFDIDCLRKRPYAYLCKVTLKRNPRTHEGNFCSHQFVVRQYVIDRTGRMRGAVDANGIDNRRRPIETVRSRNTVQYRLIGQFRSNYHRRRDDRPPDRW